jgi:hypothetical protein
MVDMRENLNLKNKLAVSINYPKGYLVIKHFAVFFIIFLLKYKCIRKANI